MDQQSKFDVLFAFQKLFSELKAMDIRSGSYATTNSPISIKTQFQATLPLSRYS